VLHGVKTAVTGTLKGAARNPIPSSCPCAQVVGVECGEDDRVKAQCQAPHLVVDTLAGAHESEINGVSIGHAQASRAEVIHVAIASEEVNAVDLVSQLPGELKETRLSVGHVALKRRSSVVIRLCVTLFVVRMRIVRAGGTGIGAGDSNT